LFVETIKVFEQEREGMMTRIAALEAEVKALKIEESEIQASASVLAIVEKDQAEESAMDGNELHSLLDSILEVGASEASELTVRPNSEHNDELSLLISSLTPQQSPGTSPRGHNEASPARQISPGTSPRAIPASSSPRLSPSPRRDRESSSSASDAPIAHSPRFLPVDDFPMDGNFTRDSKRRGPRAIKASDDAVPIITSPVSNEKPPDKSTSSALRFNLKDASSKLMSTFGRSSKRPDLSDDSGIGTPPLGRGSKAVTPTLDSIFKEPNNTNNSGDGSNNNNNNKNKTSSLLPPAADTSARSPTLGRARDLAKDKAASKEEAKLEIATPAPATEEAAPPSHMTLTSVDVTSSPDGCKKVSGSLITVVAEDGDSWQWARR
jgi:hypothetical protein